MRPFSVALLVVSLTAPVATAAAAQDLRPREGELKVGDPAPAFVLSDVEGKTATSLAALRGKPVVLVFGSCT